MGFSITPFNLSFTWNTNDTGRGVIFPKGLFLHCGDNYQFSKDGIYAYLTNEVYTVKSFFFVRFLAFIEMLLFLVALPFMVIIYPLIFVVSLLLSIVSLVPFVLLRFTLCLCQADDGIRVKLSAFYAACVAFALTSFLGILVIIGLVILLPLSLLVPEFTARILKTHKWGPPTR